MKQRGPWQDSQTGKKPYVPAVPPGRTWRALAFLVQVLTVAGVLASAVAPVRAQERRFPGQGRSGRAHSYIAGGGLHTLFINEGNVWAWGDNGIGQLGDGTTANFKTTPIQVSNSTGLVRVVAVAAGAGHSVALDANGDVWTWGDNSLGQLGDGGITPSRSLPYRLAGIPGFSRRITAIAAGDLFTVALAVDGQLWTWGDNAFGQLGDGTIIGRSVPAPIAGVIDVKQVSAGAFHGMALTVLGRIWSFGRSNHGQIGDGMFTTRPNPVELFPADPARRFIEIVAGVEHSLAIDERGNVWSWGADAGGQLGNGSAVVADQPTPAPVNKSNGFDRAVRIAAGGQHSLALNAGGRAYGWGNDAEGAVGLGSTLPGPIVHEPDIIPTISGLPGATAIATGHLHSVALLSDGRLHGWGSNLMGQVGNGSPLPVNAPVSIAGMTLKGKIMTAGAWKQSYAVRGDGHVWAWGANGEGQLGDGTNTPHSLPRRVAGIGNVIGISTNTSNVLLLRSDGTVWGWGKNQHGQMGFPPGAGIGCPLSISSNVCVPIQIGATTLTNVKAIAAGTYFHLALLADGTLWSWGKNTDGALGRGFGPDDPMPGLVAGIDGVIALAGGGSHGLALLSGGTVKSWGSNGECETGTVNCCGHNGPGVTRCNNPIAQPATPAPVDVAGQGGIGILQRITAINAALYHMSLALDINGRVWAWGDNLDGQLGDGNSGPFWVGSYPDYVQDPASGTGLLDDVDAISAGGFHGLARRSDGTVRGWGRDVTGQLGDGPPTAIQPLPVAPACLDGAVGFASGAGVGFSSVRRHDASMCPTGENDVGQLGDGTLINTDTYFCDTSEVGHSLRMDTVASGRITWDPVPTAQSYRVYRGSVAAGLFFGYNHTCLTPAGVFGCPNAAVPCPPEHFDATVPANPGDLLYYLAVSRRGAVCGEGHLGRASFYTERPKLPACP